MHRLYGSVKLAPHRPPQNEKDSKLLSFSGVANGQNPAAFFAAGLEVESGMSWRRLDFNQVPFLIGFKANCPNLEGLSPRIVPNDSGFRNGVICIRCVNNRERNKVAKKDFFHATETEKTLC
jgi:hypothetical protein